MGRKNNRGRGTFDSQFLDHQGIADVIQARTAVLLGDEDTHHAEPRCLHDYRLDLFGAGGLVKKLETRHFPGENEIAVIESERARNTIFIEVERQGIARRVVLFAGFEIADGDRPAPHDW